MTLLVFAILMRLAMAGTVPAGIFSDQERDRGDVGKRGADRYRNHRAILSDFGCVELDLVGSLGGLAIERLDRLGVALLLEGLFRIFVVGGSVGWYEAEREIAEANQRDSCRALQDQASRRREPVISGGHPKSPKRAVPAVKV